jgi:hypothetical protein
MCFPNGLRLVHKSATGRCQCLSASWTASLPFIYIYIYIWQTRGENVFFLKKNESTKSMAEKKGIRINSSRVLGSK